MRRNALRVDVGCPLVRLMYIRYNVLYSTRYAVTAGGDDETSFVSTVFTRVGYFFRDATAKIRTENLLRDILN